MHQVNASRCPPEGTCIPKGHLLWIYMHEVRLGLNNMWLDRLHSECVKIIPIFQRI